MNFQLLPSRGLPHDFGQSTRYFRILVQFTHPNSNSLTNLKQLATTQHAKDCEFEGTTRPLGVAEKAFGRIQVHQRRTIIVHVFVCIFGTVNHFFLVPSVAKIPALAAGRHFLLPRISVSPSPESSSSLIINQTWTVTWSIHGILTVTHPLIMIVLGSPLS
jgi:hypothetical protein